MCLGLGTALGSRILAFWWLECSMEEREGGGAYNGTGFMFQRTMLTYNNVNESKSSIWTSSWCTQGLCAILIVIICPFFLIVAPILLLTTQ